VKHRQRRCVASLLIRVPDKLWQIAGVTWPQSLRDIQTWLTADATVVPMAVFGVGSIYHTRRKHHSTTISGQEHHRWRSATETTALASGNARSYLFFPVHYPLVHRLEPSIILAHSNHVISLNLMQYLTQIWPLGIGSWNCSEFSSVPNRPRAQASGIASKLESRPAVNHQSSLHYLTLASNLHQNAYAQVHWIIPVTSYELMLLFCPLDWPILPNFILLNSALLFGPTLFQFAPLMDTFLRVLLSCRCNLRVHDCDFHLPKCPAKAFYMRPFTQLYTLPRSIGPPTSTFPLLCFMRRLTFANFVWSHMRLESTRAFSHNIGLYSTEKSVFRTAVLVSSMVWCSSQLLLSISNSIFVAWDSNLMILFLWTHP
jgi:hypothetical protein